MPAPRPLPVIFFRTEGGKEPAREWLKDLPADERRILCFASSISLHCPMLSKFGVHSFSGSWRESLETALIFPWEQSDFCQRGRRSRMTFQFADYTFQPIQTQTIPFRLSIDIQRLFPSSLWHCCPCLARWKPSFRWFRSPGCWWAKNNIGTKVYHWMPWERFF